MNKAFKINATTNEIEEVQINDFRDICKHGEFEIFTTGGRFPNYDILFVDDMGMINGTKRGFGFNGQLLFGNGIVCGGDAAGETQDVKITKEELEKHIEWLPAGAEIVSPL